MNIIELHRERKLRSYETAVCKLCYVRLIGNAERPDSRVGSDVKVTFYDNRVIRKNINRCGIKNNYFSNCCNTHDTCSVIKSLV